MNEIVSVPIDRLLQAHPYAKEFFLSLGLKDVAGHLTAQELVSELTDEFVEDCGMDRTQILQHFTVFIRTQKAG